MEWKTTGYLHSHSPIRADLTSRAGPSVKFPFVCLAAHELKFHRWSAWAIPRSCQTSTAAPAEPGTLNFIRGGAGRFSWTRSRQKAKVRLTAGRTTRRCALCALHGDLLFGLLGLRCLGERHGQHPILEARLDLIDIDAVRDAEGACERAETALVKIVVLPLLFLLFLLATFDDQAAGRRASPRYPSRIFRVSRR